MKAFEFKPKLFLALKNYSKELFMADLMAGIIVGIVALPLAIAFGIASGVSPEKGIITAIIAGFIISMMGVVKYKLGGLQVLLSLSYMELYNNTVKPDSSLPLSWPVYCLSY